MFPQCCSAFLIPTHRDDASSLTAALQNRRRTPRPKTKTLPASLPRSGAKPATRLRPNTRSRQPPTASGTHKCGGVLQGWPITLPPPVGPATQLTFPRTRTATTRKWKSTCLRTICPRTRTRARRQRGPNEPRCASSFPQADDVQEKVCFFGLVFGCCLNGCHVCGCTGPQRAKAAQLRLPTLADGRPEADSGQLCGDDGDFDRGGYSFVASPHDCQFPAAQFSAGGQPRYCQPGDFGGGGQGACCKAGIEQRCATVSVTLHT